MATLVQRLMDEKEVFIYSINEPYLGKKKTPVGFPRNTVIHYGGERPRAAIWTTPGALFPLTDLSDRDVMAGIFETPNGRTCFVSAYFDGQSGEVIPEKLTRIVDYCLRRTIKLIINADMNAHSTLWGCEDSDTRGEVLEDFIAQHRMDVVNIGSDPTFIGRETATIIDVTLTRGVDNAIFDWQVLPGAVASDHNLIE